MKKVDKRKLYYVTITWDDFPEGGSYGNRYKGADNPVQAFIDSIKHVP